MFSMSNWVHVVPLTRRQKEKRGEAVLLPEVIHNSWGKH